MSVYRHLSRQCARSIQRGLTLVELMVALAISLTLVVAASLLFLNTRFAQQAADERGLLQETGQLALEVIGAQIGNAGFYPMLNAETGTQTGASLTSVAVSYAQALPLVTAGAPPLALATGVFGCSNGVVKPDLSGCDGSSKTQGAAGSDALLVSYFTDDAMSLDTGARADCTRSDIANDTTYNNPGRVGSITQTKRNVDGGTAEVNVSRVSGSLDLPPLQPMMGINRFHLMPFTYVDNAGNSVTTRALACGGNGRGLNVDVILVPGVVQMTIRYGVVDDSTVAPVRYVTADQVNALVGEIDLGEGRKLATWGRVVSVKVCVMVQSMNRGVGNVSGAAVKDCGGDDLANPVVGAAYQTFTRVFGVKNRQQRSLAL